jgi:putative PIN family toxin of toxin-antitoxin system
VKIVLDTNVLVSALLRPGSLPSRVVDLVLARQVTLVFDLRIFGEYQEALLRPEFAFPLHQVSALMAFLWSVGERVQAAPLPLRLSDPDDGMFIEVAVSALADALVTGNGKHFPVSQRHGVHVLSPREWLTVWASAGSL